MKNILFLDRSLSVNGTAVYCKNFMSSLQNKAVLYFFPFKRHVYYNEIRLLTNSINIRLFITQKYKIDIIYVCTAEMFIMALLFKRYFVKEASIVYSVFHPRQNIFEANFFGNVYRKIIHKKMKESPDVFVFYNEGTKKSHEIHYQLALDKARVFPVLIPALIAPEKKHESSTTLLDTVRVVSLGRLVDFKYYHEAVIQAISVLNNSVNIKFEYHIYGDGHLRNQLVAYIERTKATQFVFLHGHLKNEAIYDTLITADLFIGMGTSLMYAASLGVPSLVAIESSNLSHGFFTSDLNGYECGEEVSELDKMTYLSILTRFLQYDANELLELKRKTVVKAQQFLFENNVGGLLELLETPLNNKLNGVSWFMFIIVLFAKIGIKLSPKQIGDK